MNTVVSSAVATLANVQHRYGKVVALDGIDLAIPAGKLAGIIGPDGVGKSTMLGLIAGARRIQHGDVVVMSENLRDVAFKRLVDDPEAETQVVEILARAAGELRRPQ